MRSRSSHGLLVLTVCGRESPDEGTKNESEEEEAASPEKPTSNGSEVSVSPNNPGVDRDPSTCYTLPAYYTVCESSIRQLCLPRQWPPSIGWSL